ncbi:hypothetical protein KVR01_004049 [Diaporthe batatas]|uniref:uncharacterized protein n=1 Tax=Diaporthe batatas TaxID=748121 RepID=UPI001D04AE2D|nr:uncharacterized protein KVR01_004049 [Diaporthe batatas]KAG8165497.1 hypothetical protein KVR01_004049 [Diaporthe batatas]
MSNNTPKPSPKTPTDLGILQASHSHLSTAAQLLDGFVHRNKNQHRGTRWWGPFDMLRRSVRKLAPDLGDAVQRAEYLSSSSSVVPATKRRKPNDKGAVAKLPGLERVEARAQWVHDVAVVKAYEAFTQLLADRQFAQLGLMLIGVLAQVEAAVAPFVRPAEPEEGVDETDAAGPAPVQQVRVAGIAAKGGGVPPPVVRGVEQEDDLGVAISRDELGDDDDDGEGDGGVVSRPRYSSPPPPKHAPSKERRPEKGEGKGKKRSRTEDAGASRIGKSEKPTRPESSKEEKKAKKKKKKKGGDEFDDLFSSLM